MSRLSTAKVNHYEMKLAQTIRTNPVETNKYKYRSKHGWMNIIWDTHLIYILVMHQSFSRSSRVARFTLLYEMSVSMYINMTSNNREAACVSWKKHEHIIIHLQHESTWNLDHDRHACTWYMLYCTSKRPTFPHFLGPMCDTFSLPTTFRQCLWLAMGHLRLLKLPWGNKSENPLTHVVSAKKLLSHCCLVKTIFQSCKWMFKHIISISGHNKNISVLFKSYTCTCSICSICLQGFFERRSKFNRGSNRNG